MITRPSAVLTLSACSSTATAGRRRRVRFASEKGEEIYDEPVRGDRVPLATEVYGQLRPGEGVLTTMLTSGGEPFFRVVSREEYYNATLRNLEGKDGASVAETR